MNKMKVIDMIENLTKKADTADGRDKIIYGYSKKIKSFNGDNSLLEQVKKLYRYFIDPSTSKSRKALIGAGLLYFIMPFDVINDFIPGLGYLDDGVAIAYVFSLVNKELEKYEDNEEMTVNEQ